MSLIIYGLVNSVILALYAVGFSLTYGISGLANFAHGALYILSGFAAWSFIHSAGLPFGLAAVLSIAVTALLGFLIYLTFHFVQWRKTSELRFQWASNPIGSDP